MSFGGGIPSLAVKGARVVCVKGFSHRCYAWERLPVPGQTLTIRRVDIEVDGVYLRFKELRNRPWFYSDSFGETRFIHTNFRPLVEGDGAAEIEAQIFRNRKQKQPHSAPRKVSA